MKKQFLFPLLAAALLTTVACSEDDPTPETTTTNETSTNTTDVGTDADAADNEQIEDSYTVTVVYSGSTATVTIPSNLSEVVTCSSGTSSNVVLTNTDVANEIAYELSGSSTSGSFVVDADYKMTVKLNGLTLTSTAGPAINVKCGKRIAVILADETTNTLVDAAGGDHSGCLRTKGHFEFEGGGTLNVTGNTKHGIASKEYTLLKKSVGTINIVSAVGDALHAGQYFQMNGGTINIDGNTMGDGIQAEFETDDNDAIVQDDENTGNAIFKGGTVNIVVAGNEDTKGIKADGGVYITGGTFTIDANSNGSRGIQADGDIEISQADESIATSITINANGGKCTVAEDATDPHRCMGMKTDGDLIIDSGTVTITATGSGARTVRCADYSVGASATFTYNKDPKTD